MRLPNSVYLSSLTILLILLPTSYALIDDVIEILKLGKDITSTLLETWNLVEQTNLGGGVEIPFRKEKQKKILHRVNEVHRKIDAFEDNVIIHSLNNLVILLYFLVSHIKHVS